MESYGRSAVYVDKKYLNVNSVADFNVLLSNADNHYLVFDIYSAVDPKHPDTHLGWISFDVVSNGSYEFIFDTKNLIKSNSQVMMLKKWINDNINDESLYPAIVHIFLLNKNHDSVVDEKKVLLFNDSTYLSNKICQFNEFSIFNPNTRVNNDNFGGFDKFIFIYDDRNKNSNFVIMKIAYSFLLVNYRRCEVISIENADQMVCNSVYIYESEIIEEEYLLDMVSLSDDNEETLNKILSLVFLDLYHDEKLLGSLEYFGEKDIYIFDNIHNNFKKLLNNKYSICLLFDLCKKYKKNDATIWFQKENNVFVINEINLNQLHTICMNFNVHYYGELLKNIFNEV